MNADQRGSVLIGERTSDIGVHVHRNAIFMCAPALPLCAWLSYSCTTAAGAATPLRSFRPKMGATPPLGMPRSAIAEGWHVHAHATLCRGVRSRVHQSLAGRRSGKRLALCVYVFFAGSTMIRPRPRLTT